MRTALALAAALVAVPAYADCEQFKWSVASERAWFEASPAALPASGGAAEPGRGYALTLAKNQELPVAPERKPAPDRFAAVVDLAGLQPGVYQVTLSQEAWIDVAQNGALVKSSDFSGRTDCPGVRKSVRFPLGAGAATVEISNASADKIMLGISAVR